MNTNLRLVPKVGQKSCSFARDDMERSHRIIADCMSAVSSINDILLRSRPGEPLEALLDLLRNPAIRSSLHEAIEQLVERMSLEHDDIFYAMHDRNSDTENER